MPNGETTPVETTIREVTVFTDRAMVTRRGTTDLAAGATELVVANLPALLDADSMRVGGRASVPVEILAVRTEKVYAVEAVAEAAAELERQVEDLERQITALDDRLAAAHLQRDFVKGLSEKAVQRFAQGLARKQVDLQAADELLAFLAERWNRTGEDVARLDLEREALARQLTALREKLQQIGTPRPRETFSLFAAVEAAQGGRFELDASYTLRSAGWTPLYDLRVDSASDAVHLAYLAEVTQRSGEDWRDVQLTLSTAKPGLGPLPPKLNPWFLDVVRPLPAAPPPPPMPRMAAAPMAAMAGAADAVAAAAPAMDVSALLAEVAQPATADLRSDGGAVTFTVSRRGDIPSDGQPHKTTIFSGDCSARLEYVAMPRLVTQAYLRATVTNGSAQLLPGQANIFRDNTFVGKTRLASVAPGEEFTLNLGIDESIKVERELVEREVDKTFIGNQRRTTYAYRITLTNLRAAATTVAVSDQLPVSRNEQIKVKLTRSQPGVQAGELGLLEWSVALPPHGKRELYVQFTVEHPRDLTITGLDI